MHSEKKKILLIGPYPPPFGGVSVHIKRLIVLLNTDFEIIKIDESHLVKPSIFNLGSLNLFKYLQLVVQSDLLHIHSGNYLLRLLHFCTSKALQKKLIITIHSYEERDKNVVEKHLDRFIFKYSSRVIFVSEDIAEKFVLQNSYIKHAFLPPNLSEEEQLPLNIQEWIKCKKTEGYSICCANASRLDVCDNQDLYGLDICIEATKKCREESIKIAFVFVVSDTSGVLKIDLYKSLIHQYNLGDLFFLYESPLSFIKLIEKSDLILRPTNTDGDALTVREGLFLGKKVIASDVAKRPAGTHIFKNRDMVSLMHILKEVIENIQNNSKSLETESGIKPLNVTSYKDFYLTNIYN